MDSESIKINKVKKEYLKEITSVLLQNKDSINIFCIELGISEEDFTNELVNPIIEDVNINFLNKCIKIMQYKKISACV